MRFSVVMQSTLKHYPGCASDREIKLLRAVESVAMQTHKDTEMIVVADRCQQTANILSGLNVKLIRNDHAPKSAKWFSGCRNIGKDNATGEYIVYLDNDDFYTKHYLEQLNEEIERDLLAWYWCDHLEFMNGKWGQKNVSLVANSAGTANVVHRRDLTAQWPNECHYGSEDWVFIRRLMSLNLKHRHLDVAGYCIGHIRNRYDL